MDNIKFVGYAANRLAKKALKNRVNPMELETFYNAVNQGTVSGCSCCKKEVVLYFIQPVGLAPINPTVLSLCVECLKSLPVELRVINIDSNGAPPALIYNLREV